MGERPGQPPLGCTCSKRIDGNEPQEQAGTPTQPRVRRVLPPLPMLNGLDRSHHACFSGVSVLGLGALNKAEFINRGGEDVLRAVTPRKTRHAPN